jgi:hypothetical protein
MLAGIREQRGIGHHLCPGGRDPALESASAVRMCGQGPGTPWQTRERAVAPSLVRPDLSREGAEAPSLVLINCINKVIP